MAIDRTGGTQTKHSEQNIQNASFDEDLKILSVQTLGFDGVSLQRTPAGSFTVKITEVSPVTYIAKARPGTAQATAKWQVMKIDETTGTVITWADGNSDFDNVATDLTALSYS